MTTPRTRPTPPMTAKTLNWLVDAKTALNAKKQAADENAEAERSFRRMHASDRFRARLYL